MQFHNGRAQVSMTDMNLTIDGRASVSEPWSMNRATLIPNEGTDMETEKKCIDIFKKDPAVASLLQFAIKKATVDGESSGDESNDDGPKPSSTARPPSTPRAKAKSEATTMKNAPVGFRAAMSPAQRAALDALKAGTS